ncbi:hypothetical protein Drorol1_Dr00002510 [Drosera rotundifolia]
MINPRSIPKFSSSFSLSRVKICSHQTKTSRQPRVKIQPQRRNFVEKILGFRKLQAQLGRTVQRRREVAQRGAAARKETREEVVTALRLAAHCRTALARCHHQHQPFFFATAGENQEGVKQSFSF